MLYFYIFSLLGCKVIAFSGSDEKVAWTKELGADHAFNYKTANVGEELGQAAPEKINCFFENVSFDPFFLQILFSFDLKMKKASKLHGIIWVIEFKVETVDSIIFLHSDLEYYSI